MFLQIGESLEFLLGGAPATTQPSATGAYLDYTTSTFVGTGPTPFNATANSTTAVTLAAAPAAGKTRQIGYLAIFNLDTAAVTVTVRKNVSATYYNLVKATIQTGETLYYRQGSWGVSDANGASKANIGSTIGGHAY